MRITHTEEEIEKLIRSGQFDRFVSPNYDGLSIANLAPTIAKLLKADLNGTELKRNRLAYVDEEIKHVILFIVDALGHNLLAGTKKIRKAIDLAFPKGHAKRTYLTSVFPSTTSAALTSISTGLTPSEHGMLGYNLFLKELGSVVNMITLSPVNERERSRIFELGLTPEKLLPHPKLTEALGRSGISTRFMIRFELKGSGLSTLLYKGSEAIPYLSLSDMFLSLSNLLEVGKDGLTIVYWDGLDSIQHHYGPFSRETNLELSIFLNLLKEFFRNLKKKSADGVFFILSSDHGQAQTRDEFSFKVEEIPWLKESLAIPPTGEGRCAYMYLRRDAKEFERKFKEKLGKHFHLVKTDESVKSGLFGRSEMSRTNFERLGDFISLARGSSKLIFTYDARERHEPPFVRYGSHGGLTLNEMIVPLISSPLSSLVG
ncbi:MAG: alkaline phosphatase family protein [Thermoproteota archaeon]